MAGSVIMDMLPESERAVLREALQVCIVENKTAYYILHGPPSPGMIAGPDIKWRVTLIPYESDGTAAAVAICVVLPSNYAEFNDDDKNVLRYLSKDMTLKDIAASCNRSESAVDAKIRILKDKLNVSNLAGLVGAALVNHVI